MSAQKPGLHPRNRHHSRYDLATLCQVNPELRQFLTLTPAGEQSVDFANPLAVKVVKKEMAQGQKQSRFIAWTFMNDEQRRRFVNRQR